MVKRGEVFLCESHGTEKPCVILSPDEMAETMPYVLIAPITTAERNLPFRLGVKLRGKTGQIAPDMLHAVPKSDLISRIGNLPEGLMNELNQILKEIFCYESTGK
ncbi:MAG: type II toxin-antitoxin system PemK/MazF family toxin [Alphaproteobacteria bacterium]|nr:type II toxin-antitoxin system PemK/MazF family toxin [Alphaproteobacteria bacterium]